LNDHIRAAVPWPAGQGTAHLPVWLTPNKEVEKQHTRVDRAAGYPGYAVVGFPQPQRGCVTGRAPKRHNRVAVGNDYGPFTQGSPLRGQPLGWMTLPRWGNQ